MARDIEEKMVFGLAPGAPGEAPLVLLGIPAGAWEHMKDGKSHSFDLQSVGIPVRLMLYGAADHRAAVSVIEDVAKAQGIPLHDRRRDDFSIKPPSGG